MKPIKTVCMMLSFIFAAAPLFAGSITNEGATPVQISGKSVSGIMGGGTIQPGKSLPMRQKFLWIKHIPDGPASSIRIKIVEDNGMTGYITTSGGVYTCSDTAQQTAVASAAKSASPLRQGYVTNSSNAAIYLTTIRKNGEQKTSSVMTSQTVSIPEDTTEVRTELRNSSFGDVQIAIMVVMPDGRSTLIRSAKGLVRLKE